MSSKSALIALHVIAEEGRDGDGCHAPGLGDGWKMGCPKSPMWESEGEVWWEDKSVSSSGSCEGNVCNDALHVIGLYGSGGKISLFLQDWELLSPLRNPSIRILPSSARISRVARQT